ncbi:MAG TPA: hypothetical protein VIJ25_18485, partial [Methylococcales bacterium]
THMLVQIGKKINTQTFILFGDFKHALNFKSPKDQKYTYHEEGLRRPLSTAIRRQFFNPEK